MTPQGSAGMQLRSIAEPRIATLAGDDIVARRIAQALAAHGFETRFCAEDLDPLIDGETIDVLVATFGHGLTERDRHLRTLRRLVGEQCRIVAVIPADSRRGVRRALEVGADGVVFEADLETVLSPTVHAVLAGQIAIPAGGRVQVDRPALSFREKEILGYIVTGMSNKEISTTLFLAESTVKCHLSSAFTKLGVRSRNEAADLILNEGAELGLADLVPAAGVQSCV